MFFESSPFHSIASGYIMEIQRESIEGTMFGMSFYVTQVARMHESTNCLRRNCTWATNYALKSKDVKHISKTQRPRFAQGQPKGCFQMKELDRTTEAIVPMNEMWRKLNVNMRQYVSLRANMGQHCSLQLCRERQTFRSYGTSSSQGWLKRIIVQSKFDP